jgi:hypothetical protein
MIVFHEVGIRESIMAPKVRIRILAALLTAFGSAGANAAMLTQPVDCFRGFCSSVAGFDASLGTLQSVSFEGSVRDDAAFGVANLSDAPVTDVVTILSNFQFAISKAGSSLNLTGSDVREISFTLDPFASTIIAPSGTADVSGTTRDVAGFIGTDPLSFDLQSQISASARQFLITVNRCACSAKAISEP